MAVQAPQEDTSRNPRTVEEARLLVKHVESLFMPWNVDALRVDMPGALARLFVIPRLPSFLGRYPDLRLELGMGLRPVDLLEEGIDCVVRFGTLPPFRGREVLRTFFANRSARQRNYRLTKQFRTLMGDTITNSWEGSWQDTETGLAMKGFGVEVWVMRDGRIAIWDAAFNVGRTDQAMSVGDLLR